MKCMSCEGNYLDNYAGTCKKCYDDVLKDLKAKVAFLTTSQPASFSDVLLFASDSNGSVPVPAHKAILGSRSPVFRAMLENEMEESLGGTIKIGDVSYEALHAFVNYLYTAEVCLDQQLACDLLVLAEKYQVQHLKDYCQKFLVSNLNWDNSLTTYTFAHHHNAKHIVEAALTLITDNMDKIKEREEYAELKKKDPGLVFDIYEAYLSKQVNTAGSAAARKDTSAEVPLFPALPTVSIFGSRSTIPSFGQPAMPSFGTQSTMPSFGTPSTTPTTMPCFGRGQSTKPRF